MKINIAGILKKLESGDSVVKANVKTRRQRLFILATFDEAEFKRMEQAAVEEVVEPELTE